MRCIIQLMNSSIQEQHPIPNYIQFYSLKISSNHMIVEIISIIILIYVLNRYFSGAQYKGQRPDLKNCTAIVTGGNTGIGKETVLALAQQGCNVVIGARDTAKSEAAVKQINLKTNSNLVKQRKLDLGSKESIKEFVEEIESEKIDFLVNNAGIMALPTRRATKDGYQMQYGVNHLGHFYLTHLLWPKLNRSTFFRVINVSSLAHKRVLGFLGPPTLDFDNINYQKIAYDPHVAYSRSKLYNVLFTHALSERIPDNRGISLSLHPGVVRTELIRQSFTGMKLIMYKLGQPLFSIFSKSPLQGAQTSMYTLFENPQKLKNGYYYAECALSPQNKLVTKGNWDKLWEISEQDLKIKFDTQ